MTDFPQTSAEAEELGYVPIFEACDPMEGIGYIHPEVAMNHDAGVVAGSVTLHYDTSGEFIGVVAVINGDAAGPTLPLLGAPDEHPGPPSAHYHLYAFLREPTCQE